MGINWKAKLTSRKFWLAIVGFVGPLLLAFGVAEETVAQVTSLIISGASVVAYIIAEGMVDASAAKVADVILADEIAEAEEITE